MIKKTLLFIALISIPILLIWNNSITPNQENLMNARQMMLNKKYNKANTLYKSMISTHPNDFVINYNLASSYYRLNELLLAKLYFLKALQIKPNDQDTMHNVSIINKQFIDEQFILCLE